MGDFYVMSKCAPLLFLERLNYFNFGKNLSFLFRAVFCQFFSRLSLCSSLDYRADTVDNFIEGVPLSALGQYPQHSIKK